MSIITFIALFIVFNFPHIYGIAENRLFREQGEMLPGNHFKIYHLWLFFLFAGTGVIIYALSSSIILTLSYFIYSPFGLDWVWWAIRYFDFQKDPVKAQKNYGEPNAWHLQTDWDNYLKLPLIYGTYWWWYLFGGTSLTLFLIYFFRLFL
jgi:hypothetical protein